jgi:signal peptidase I
MKSLLPWILPALLVAWFAAEILTFVRNPFHVPAAQLPLRLFGLQYFKSTDATMEPTVRNGEYVMVSAWPLRKRKPKVGDVVVLAYPAGSQEFVLRRVVAAGGSKIDFRNGRAVVDGKPEAAPWLDGQPEFLYTWIVRNRGPLPEDCLYVLGDNRGLAQDSREWGCVPGASIAAIRP